MSYDGGRSQGNGLRRPMSVAEIQRIVLMRIASGVYPMAGRMPSCERFAAELAANKNTVSKAYQALAARGYLDSKPGRGTIVARRPPSAVLDQAAKEFRLVLEQAVEQAQLSGLDMDSFRILVDETIKMTYRDDRPRVGYVDCNMVEGRVLSRELQQHIGHPVEPLLVQDVVADIDKFLATYDILAVNLSHLVEVEEKISAAPADRRAEIVPLLTPPDSESLTRVARLAPGSRVGIVCTTTSAIETISGHVRAMNPAVAIVAVLASEHARLRGLLEDVDVLLVTSTSGPAVDRLAPTLPIIQVTFRVDDREAQRVADRLASRIARRSLPETTRRPANPGRSGQLGRREQPKRHKLRRQQVLDRLSATDDLRNSAVD